MTGRAAAKGEDGGDGTDLAGFRRQVAEFLTSSKRSGAACPAFGAILPPALHDRARRWQRRTFDAGLAGLHWPVDAGGRGLDRRHTAIWFEECAKAQVAPYLNLQGLVLAGEAILRSGTDRQRHRFLPATLTGEILWCQLFSEPDAGSDLASLATSAVADGDRFIVSGQKVWSSNAQQAEHAILLARTDPDQPGHRGISFFLLDMHLPGVDVRPLRQMTGDAEFCEVFLDGVELPADALLGPLHHGWQVAMAVLQDERGSAGAAGLLGLQRRLEHLRSLTTGDPVPGDELMRLLVRGHGLESLLMRQNTGPGGSSAAKLLRTELELDAELLETSLRGAAAMLQDETTRRFLHAPGMRIAGGTSEIQRNIIGERILGLPREPRA